MIRSVLASDHIPSAVELCLIHAEIERDTAQLKCLEAHTSSLEATLSQVQAERDSIARRIETNKSIYAPIRKLPCEILGLIFSWCLDAIDFTRFVSKSQIGSLRAPMVLTRVCRKWRRVAFGTPQLWTTLDIGEDSIRQLNLPVVLPFWFERSGALPLDIRFDLGFDVHGQFQKPFLPARTGRSMDICALIRKNLDRCRTLVLGLDVSCRIHVRKALFTPPPRPCLSSLEALVIDSGGWDLCRLGEIDAPKLRLLSIEGYVCDPSRLPDSFPSSRATLETLVFTNADTNIPALVTFVGMWSALVNCHIGITVLEAPTMGVRSLISLPVLRSLHIDWFRNLDPIMDFLGAFLVPSLQSLELQYENEFEEDCGTINFADLIANGDGQTSWTRSLKELKLTGMDINESRVVRLLRSCPNLEKLRLRWCEGIEPLLRALGGSRCFTRIRSKEGGCSMGCCWKLALLEFEGVFDVARLRRLIDLRAGSYPWMVSCDEGGVRATELKQVVIVVETVRDDTIALKTAYPDVVTIVEGYTDRGLVENGDVVKQYW